MDVPDRRLERAAIAAICIGFVLWSAAFIYRSSFIAVDGRRYFCLFDDAMISMRYAWNLSHGFGLVWNPGERIEGYTNLLMTLLMSFPNLIFDKSAASLFMQITGVIFMLAIACVTMRIADHFVQDESYERQALIRVLACFGALAYYPLAYWSLMGVETGLLTLLLLLGVLFALNYSRTSHPRLLLSVAGCLGLAYLTRNDSVIFAMLIWLYIVWHTLWPKSNRSSLRPLLAAISLWLSFVIGQLLFRYVYYGELLPNTFTLKLTGMPLLFRLENGAGFVTPFLVATAFILVLSTADLILHFRRQKVLLLSIAFSAIGYQVFVGGDAWDWWRIMSPTFPLLAVLFTVAVNSVIRALSRTRAYNVCCRRSPVFLRQHIAGVLLVVLTLMGWLSADARFKGQISLLAKPYDTEYNRINVNIALMLRQLTTNDATVGVIAAGALPYFAERRAIDFLGKSDRYIAHLPPDMSGSVGWFGMKSVPGHNKYDLNYSIKTLQPTYVQFYGWGAQNLTQWAETRYVTVDYHGVRLRLLRDSPAILWQKVNAP